MLSRSFLVFSFLLIGCTAGGPPFKDREGVAAEWKGRYTFRPPLPYYERIVGEVTFTGSRTGTDFVLRMVGFQGAAVEGPLALETPVRMRHWEGQAYEHDGHLELRAVGCYEFGRTGIEERQAPLQGFSCDHLLLAFVDERPIRLRGVKIRASRDSDWFGPIDLIPQPESFYGAQVLSSLNDGRSVAYGLGAPRVLRKGARLRGPEGQTLQVESIPGDLVILSGPVLPHGTPLRLLERPLGALPISF
ncbi:MAG: hypothetical protein HS115_20130 [Spirochaetales bacterium]|nr:hypothetical protein [Spirochaetales bacterium]